MGLDWLPVIIASMVIGASSYQSTGGFDIAELEEGALELSVAGESLTVLPRDISYVNVYTSPETGLQIALQTEAAAWLAGVTSAHIGQPMSLSICGAEITAPVIREVIVSGDVLITGGYDTDMLDAASQVLYGQINCFEFLSIYEATHGQ